MIENSGLIVGGVVFLAFLMILYVVWKSLSNDKLLQEKKALEKKMKALQKKADEKDGS